MVIDRLTANKLIAIKELQENCSLSTTFYFRYSIKPDKTMTIRISSKRVVFEFYNDGINTKMTVTNEKFIALTMQEIQEYIDFYFKLDKEDEEKWLKQKTQ